MTILLLGATGRTGIFILENLLQEGYNVRVLVRNNSKIKIQTQKLNIIEGSTTNSKTIGELMEGCDAVISALNVARTSDFPWAKLRTPTTFLSDTMTAILDAVGATSVKKIIVCSAWGVHETKRDIPNWFRWLIDNSNIGAAYKDHEKQEDLLQRSKIDYTIVRPVGLTNSKKDETAIVSIDNKPKPRLTISRKSVAKFMIAQLNDSSYSRKAVTISKK